MNCAGSGRPERACKGCVHKDVLKFDKSKLDIVTLSLSQNRGSMQVAFNVYQVSKGRQVQTY